MEEKKAILTVALDDETFERIAPLLKRRSLSVQTVSQGSEAEALAKLITDDVAAIVNDLLSGSPSRIDRPVGMDDQTVAACRQCTGDRVAHARRAGAGYDRNRVRGSEKRFERCHV